MTPKQRADAIRRIAEIDERLEDIRGHLQSGTIQEWIDLFKERHALIEWLQEADEE
jgi:hypothetical protein